ncbi:hypothetical protein SLS62_007426 [Diatrype stigma]|uniref:Uncharacterized protein n=1 Tax=Diatrype stigma TaxID=117547 RepID=A0AAN9UL93_9PEZI
MRTPQESGDLEFGKLVVLEEEDLRRALVGTPLKTSFSLKPPDGGGGIDEAVACSEEISPDQEFVIS